MICAHRKHTWGAGVDGHSTDTAFGILNVHCLLHASPEKGLTEAGMKRWASHHREYQERESGCLPRKSWGEPRGTEHRIPGTPKVMEGRREAWDGAGIEQSGMNHLGQSKENIVVKTGSWLPVLAAAGG